MAVLELLELFVFANSSRQTVEGMYFHLHTLILTHFRL